MQLLDEKKLAALKQEFEKFPDGLELSTFIWYHYFFLTTTKG